MYVYKCQNAGLSSIWNDDRQVQYLHKYMYKYSIYMPECQTIRHLVPYRNKKTNDAGTGIGPVPD
jgi:hypothetical protein